MGIGKVLVVNVVVEEEVVEVAAIADVKVNLI